MLIFFSCLPDAGQASTGKQSDNRPKADADKKPVATLEVGVASSWNIKGGAATFAPNLAAELTPIENWLELEAGVSAPFDGEGLPNRRTTIIKNGVLVSYLLKIYIWLSASVFAAPGMPHAVQRANHLWG
jgi:hypothetical protein